MKLGEDIGVGNSGAYLLRAGEKRREVALTTLRRSYGRQVEASPDGAAGREDTPPGEGDPVSPSRAQREEASRVAEADGEAGGRKVGAGSHSPS